MNKNPFTVKFDSASFKKVEASIKKDLEVIIKNPEMLNEAGLFLVERIKYQARIGLPVNSDWVFPRLQPSTIRNRRRLGQLNATHQTFKPERSNLTITGQFLDSLWYVIEGTKVLISFKGIHPGYTINEQGGRSPAISNDLLATYLKDKGFRAFDKALAKRDVVVKRLTSIVNKYLRRGLKVRNNLKD